MSASPIVATLRAYVNRGLTTLRSCATVIVLITVIFLGGMLLSELSNRYWGIVPAELFRDPNALSDAPHYFGLFSQLGLIIWAGAAGALLLTVLTGVTRGRDRQYVLYSLAFTLVLLLDDGFQLHENYSPQYKTIDYLHLVYILMIGLYFLLFREQLLRSPLILLLLALFFFGGSLAFDAVPNREAIVRGHLVYYVEDGLKLLGLCFWTAFYFFDCRGLLRGNIPQATGKNLL